MRPEYLHYLATFLLQASMMLGMTLIPFFVKDHLGGGDRSVAFAYGIQMVALSVACFASAPFLSNVANAVPWCLAGMIGFGVLYASAMYAPGVITFYVLTSLAMGFFALAWPALQSWLGAQPDRTRRTKSLSHFNTVLGLGLIAGPVIAGLCYSIDYRLAFAAVFLTAAMAAGLIRLLPSEAEYFGTAPGQRRDGPEDLTSGTDTAGETYLYVGWVTGLLAWGLVGAVRTVYAMQVDDLVKAGQLVLFSKSHPGYVFTAGREGMAATLYAWMQAVLSGGYFAAVILMGWMTRWQYRLWLIVLIEAVTAMSIWWLAGSGSLAAILACHALFGAYTGFGYQSSQCYSMANPRLRHRRVAINEGIANGGGGFVIPMVFVQLGEWYGRMWPFVYAPLFAVVGMGSQVLLLRHGRRKLGGREPDTASVTCRAASPSS